MVLIIFPLKVPDVGADSIYFQKDNFEAYFRSKQAGNLDWDPITRLSITPTNTTDTQIASNQNYDPDYIMAVFKDELTGDYDIYFRKSFDGGISWTERAMGIDTDYDVSPIRDGISMAIDTKGNAHLAWHRGLFGSGDTTGLYYSRYNGSEWINPITIAEMPGPTNVWIGLPTIIVGTNDTLHLSYGLDQPGNDNGAMMYTRSLDGGLSWSAPVDINDFSWMDVGHKAGLCADSKGNVFIAFGPDWHSPEYLGETYFRRSQDNGATWGNQTTITKGEFSEGHVSLLCNDSGGLYLVYKGTRQGAAQDSGMKEILYKYSLDYGNSWIPDEGGIYIETTADRYCNVYSALGEADIIHIVFDNITTSGVHEGYYIRINRFGDIIEPKTIITPDDSLHSYVRSLSAYGDRVFVGFDNWVISPRPLNLYIKTDGVNILLNWTQTGTTGLAYYLIYRATSQTGFDFSSFWVNTSYHDDNGTIPLRTTWNDTNAASENAPQEYYYTIRTVYENGDIGPTSRTVGKWTATFSPGVSTSALPLEPLQSIWTDNFTENTKADYIKYMDPVTHRWQQHSLGDGNNNNTKMTLGEGYEIKFSNNANYTFCGLPAAMIFYNDDSGFLGFDPESNARNLTAVVEVNGDVNLTWDEPACMDIGDIYNVYYSNKRDGFFGIPGYDYFSLGTVAFKNHNISHKKAQADDPGARLYYMVVPYNSSGIQGSSTYSIGIWTEEYSCGYDTIGIPLKLENNYTADWYCDNIPDCVGINYFNSSKQRWYWHSTIMPEGAFDTVLEMTKGYQISTSDITRFIFIGI
ncbi:MAG: exo-alpha-sialidase [Thermoplasmata archaeon]|nr:MAG: exo-alpha-sialidase [Thermoplasmata archaeon]